MTEQKSEKKRGKRAEPTLEELEFIYERLPDRSDKDIVDDIQDETIFPPRSDAFIKRRRREYEVAEKVIMRRNEGAYDPDVAKRQKRHYERLAERAQEILECLKTYFPYVDNRRIVECLVEEDDRVAATLLSKSNLLSSCLLTHLKNEYSQLNILLNWEELIISDIEKWELIHILGSKAEKGTFKGTCDICENRD